MPSPDLGELICYPIRKLRLIPIHTTRTGRRVQVVFCSDESTPCRLLFVLVSRCMQAIHDTLELSPKEDWRPARSIECPLACNQG